MTSYGALLRDQGRADERIDGHGDQLAVLREEIRALPGQIERAVRSVDDHCEKRHVELKESIETLEDKLEKKITGVEKKVGEERQKREWTVKERAMIYAAIAGPMATGLVVYLDKSPAS